MTDLDNNSIVFNKTQKKVFKVEGHNLRLVAEVKSRSNKIWDESVEQDIHDRATALLG